MTRPDPLARARTADVDADGAGFSVGGAGSSPGGANGAGSSPGGANGAGSSPGGANGAGSSSGGANGAGSSPGDVASVAGAGGEASVAGAGGAASAGAAGGVASAGAAGGAVAGDAASAGGAEGSGAGGGTAGAGAAAPAPGGAVAGVPCSRSGRAQAWAELLRLPALFTVPGDALAGAAAAGGRPGPRTLLAIGSSLCLYQAGMALNDWADRAEDAVERPHRPLPSGRVRPAAALAAACGLTGAGLALAAGAGRPALAVAAPLAATVWAYDLALKHTPAGPAAMAAARGLDLLLGAAAGNGGPRAALPSAALLGTHTLAVTTVSRRETTGGSALAPLAALATTGVLARLVTRRATRLPAGRRAAAAPGLPGSTPGARTHPVAGALTTALATAYAATAARPYVHAALNPSPPLTQRAVGGGIRATIPLQAALAARSGAPVTSLLVAALAPAGRRFARRAGMRKVSIT